MIKCFIDTETTGLDYARHAVHQVAAVLTDENLKYIDHINLMFRPREGAVIDEAAFEKCRLTGNEVLSRRMHSEDAFKAFEEFLSPHINRFDKESKGQFIAYNSPFDEGMFRAWGNAHGGDIYNFYFFNPSLCVQRQAAWLLQDDRSKVWRMKLADVCEYAGIDFNENEAHDAMYDVKKMLELYKEIR
jgi:DNA polymerase III epsilon subunit-like protein